MLWGATIMAPQGLVPPGMVISKVVGAPLLEVPVPVLVPVLPLVPSLLGAYPRIFGAVYSFCRQVNATIPATVMTGIPGGIW